MSDVEWSEPGEVTCQECGYPMQKIRTETSAVAWLHRFQCVACDAVGTVEVRGEGSIADESPKREHHGSAAPTDQGGAQP